MSVLRYILLFMVYTYQIIGSPIMRRRGVCCMRVPTCSQYAVLALRKHPVPKAIRLIRQRVKDCRVGASRGLIDYP